MNHPLAGLKASAAVVAAIGALLLLGALPPLDAVIGWLADLIFWPLDGAETARDPLARLVLAIGGGLALGWAALIWGLADRATGADPEALRRIVIRSYLVWFVADSAVSVLVGAWPNAVGNIGFLALVLAPLRRPGAVIKA